MKAGIALDIATPSPWLDHPPEAWEAHQRAKNAYLKLSLRLKRKYQRPAKPLPLP